MTLQVADRVKETTTTTGTGALTLVGAITGYRAFSSVCAVADTCHYALQAVDATGMPSGDWEVGIGTYSATNILTRTTILASSNAGAVVNLAAGTKQIWIDYPAAAINSGPLAGMRNKIIGGDFGTNPFQRGSFNVTTNGVYMADRWSFINGGASPTVVTFGADATLLPTVAQAGRLVTKNLLIVVNTADPTVGAGEVIGISQKIEGYDFQSLAQKPMVFSFWHCHSKTGIYCVAFKNSGNDRCFIAEYTQSVSNAYEYTSIVIPPSPAAGTWDYTNGSGLWVAFIFMAGTNFQTPAQPNWQTGNAFASPNQINGVDAVNNSFRFALIQLEPGTIATPFEDLPIQTVLQLCQRYYCKSFQHGTAPAGSVGLGTGEIGFRVTNPGAVSVLSDTISFPVVMRTSPTILLFNPSVGNSQVRNITTGADCTTSAGGNQSDSGFQVSCVQDAGAALGHNLRVHWTASAEF